MMQPNPSMMLEHLNLMFGRVATEYPGGRVEIRCLHPDTGRPDAHTFDASTGLKDAAEYAEENNRNGLNIYFGINPRMPSVAPFGACSKVDVDAAFFSCADLDDQKSYTRYKESNNLKPSFVVVTGTIPDKRGHLYFEHEDICRNLDAWKGIQCGIIDHYASDPHIKDTPRIMRLAGSISYPSKKKAEKGYVAEIVKLIKLDGSVYSTEELAAVFPPHTDRKTTSLNLPAPHETLLDVESCIKSINEGNSLHSNACALVACYVSRGHSDQDIYDNLHELLEPVSDGNTLGKIGHFIKSARTKFETEEPVNPIPMASLEDEVILSKLALMSPIEYDKVRKVKAESLGIRPGTLDKEVQKRRPKEEANPKDKTLSLREYEPWPEAVTGEDLLGKLVDVFTRYLSLADGAAEAIALWVVHTYAFDAFQITPRLGITSPEKRCGKSTLLALIQCLVKKPLPASNITAAALFRAVEMLLPTLLIDEADTFLNDNNDLRGILNSGHNRSSANVIRTAGDDHEPRMFATWAPVAIAMIGKLPGTLEDRSISIQMRRKRPDESVERFRADRTEYFETLARMCTRFVDDNLTDLKNADPSTPAELHDRAADNWRPLLAIADVAGGKWPDVARKVAVKLTGSDDESDSARVQILIDIKALFENEFADRLTSAFICEELIKMEDRPWPEFGRSNKPLSTRQLAKLLKPFEINPGTVRTCDSNAKGYKKEDFVDAFNRYLPKSIRHNVTTESDSQIPPILSVTNEPDVTERKVLDPAVTLECDVVTDKTPEISKGV